MSNTDEAGTALFPVLTPIFYSGVCIGQGWQKSGKYSYFPGRREILGNKIDS
jgi:hypothetical protein